MGLDVATLKDGELRRLMIEEPRLMRRPVLKIGRKVLIGFNADDWDAALA